MNATFKKDLKRVLEAMQNAQAELESFKEDFESWKDDHDYDWECTSAGEYAQTELDELDYIDLDSAIESIESILDGSIHY